MTREEFASKRAESEKRIRRRVIPLGIIYSIQFASIVGGIGLGVLLGQRFTTEPRATILAELAFCVGLFFVSFLAERDAKRSFVRLALKCPSCQSCLVFLENGNDEEKMTLVNGLCYRCGTPVFNP